MEVLSSFSNLSHNFNDGSCSATPITTRERPQTVLRSGEESEPVVAVNSASTIEVRVFASDDAAFSDICRLSLLTESIPFLFQAQFRASFQLCFLLMTTRRYNPCQGDLNNHTTRSITLLRFVN